MYELALRAIEHAGESADLGSTSSQPCTISSGTWQLLESPSSSQFHSNTVQVT